MTTIGGQAPSLTHPTGSRVRLALSAALAVAAIGVGATATGVLATGSLTADAAVASAPAVPAVPAPVAAGTAAVPTAPAPPSAGAPAGGPALADTTGATLPAAAAGGARTVFDALARGDLTALRGTYAPAAGGASWSAVAQVVADPRERAGLLAALAAPPQARADVGYLYTSGGHRVGIDDAGRLRFVRAP